MLEAEALCDRIAILDAGRLVALDTPAALTSQADPVDGRAATLEEVFTRYKHQLKGELSKQERDELIAFLESL